MKQKEVHPDIEAIHSPNMAGVWGLLINFIHIMARHVLVLTTYIIRSMNLCFSLPILFERNNCMFLTDFVTIIVAT